MSEADVQRVLEYLNSHAVAGACRLPEVRVLAQELAMKPGRVKAVLYYLCGEGMILREAELVLLLTQDMPDSGKKD